MEETKLASETLDLWQKSEGVERLTVRVEASAQAVVDRAASKILP